MGLTKGSTGLRAVDMGLTIKKRDPTDRVIALAGNPNVGKSTVFNALTGMNQHTGNWPGKTVSNAQGYVSYQGQGFILVDIPGSYSLMAHSAEEQVARDFICFGGHDGVVVVCDATCLERNLNLVIQTIEITDQVIVCVNLMDEAQRKGIHVDFSAISQRLGVPVVPATAAQNKNGLNGLMEAICTLSETEFSPPQVWYGKIIEDAVALLEPVLKKFPLKGLKPRWLALRLLDQDETLQQSFIEYLGYDFIQEPSIQKALEEAGTLLKENNIDSQILRDRITAALVLTAEETCAGAIHYDRETYDQRDRRIDRILTGKWTGFPVMLLLLAGVFWLTISGANGLSQLLSQGLFQIQDWMTGLLARIGAPDWVNGVLVEGMYRTLACIIIIFRDSKTVINNLIIFLIKLWIFML